MRTSMKMRQHVCSEKANKPLLQMPVRAVLQQGSESQIINRTVSITMQMLTTRVMTGSLNHESLAKKWTHAS